jgi:hypothetical protein
LRKVSPGFSWITGDRLIGSFSSFRKCCIAILPTLKSTPCKADGVQAMGLSVAGIQADGTLEHLESVFGAYFRMLAVEKQAADKTLPRIQALRRFSFLSVMLCSIDSRLNATDHVFGNFILDCEDIVNRPIVAFRPDVITGLCLD